MSERTARWIFHVVAALVAVRWFLLGVGQLPPATMGEWGAGAVLFLSFIVWARSQLPRGDHPLIRRDAGLLMVVLAPITTLYYLVATRQARPRSTSLAVGAGLLSPAATFFSGAVLATAVPIPPRFVQLSPEADWIVINAATGTDIVRGDLDVLGDFLQRERAAGRPLPADVRALYDRWHDANAVQWRHPYDPFTALGYLYETRDTGFVLWSSGPDKNLGNADDIWYDWPARTDTLIARGN